MGNVQVKYHGSIRYVGHIADDLQEAGLKVRYQAPFEERSGGGPSVVNVVYFVVGSAVGGAIGDYSAAAVRAIVAKIREKLPSGELEIVDQSGDE